MTTQAELIAAVAKDAGVSQADAGKVLTAIVENIHKSLKSGGDVRISNLGVFDTAARAAREGRNPATGATIKIAASKAVRFRVSKPLKDAVNQYEPRAIIRQAPHATPPPTVDVRIPRV